MLIPEAPAIAEAVTNPVANDTRPPTGPTNLHASPPQSNSSSMQPPALPYGSEPSPSLIQPTLSNIALPPDNKPVLFSKTIPANLHFKKITPSLATISESPTIIDLTKSEPPELMDIDDEVPFKRSLPLMESHPFLKRRSLTAVEIRDPARHIVYLLHIGQIAQFISYDNKIRRGTTTTDHGIPPLGYSTWTYIFNTADSAAAHNIKFCTYDDSISSPIIPDGSIPHLTDFDINRELVYPTKDSSTLIEARRTQDAGSSNKVYRGIKPKVARGSTYQSQDRTRGPFRGGDRI